MPQLKKAKERAAAKALALKEEAAAADGLTHGGAAGGAAPQRTRAKTDGEAAAAEAAAAPAASDDAAAAAAAGPQFPTLGVTLAFLEAFVQDKVAGKASRYCTANVDCVGADDGFLTFKKGDIVAIAGLDAVNDGWFADGFCTKIDGFCIKMMDFFQPRFVGYCRAGNWEDRKKFRPAAVDRLSGLSTDEVCSLIIKPETSAASWAADEKERSYARMVRDAGGTGVDTATVFASHAWTFVFEELIESLKFFEEQQLAAGKPQSYFWLDIFVVDENAAHTYPSEW